MLLLSRASMLRLCCLVRLGPFSSALFVCLLLSHTQQCVRTVLLSGLICTHVLIAFALVPYFVYRYVRTFVVV